MTDAPRREPPRIRVRGSDPRPQSAEDARSLGRRAGALYAAGRLAEALAACRALIALEPGRADACAFAGRISLELGEPLGAARFYREAVARRPDFAEAWYNLGNALRRAGDAAGAIEAYAQAVQARPDLAPAHLNLGNALLAQGRPGEAAAAYRRAAALAPEAAEAPRNLGIALERAGDVDGALAAYREALALRPGWDAPYSNLATLLLDAEDAAAASAACDAWLARFPASVEAHALKCVALNELGDRSALGRLLDFERFVHTRRIEPPPGFASLDAFNGALAREVLSHPTLAVPPEDDPTYHHPKLQITDELLADELRADELRADELRAGDLRAGEPLPGDAGRSAGSALAALGALIREAITAYRSAVDARPPHPFLEHWPARWQLATWAVVLAGEGNLVPHIHLDGYLGGVYYVRLPERMRGGEDGEAGWFELGRPPAELHTRATPRVHRIRPEEGRMILFPGYFYHGTVPFRSAGERISIAFDLVPAS